MLGKLRLMKPKPLMLFAKASSYVYGPTIESVHGTESCRCAKLDSDQVRVASIEGELSYLICSLD